MTHGISEREWLEYLEGRLSRPRAVEIRRHLDGCPDCMHLLGELMEWQRRLTEEGGQLRSAMTPSPDETDRFVDRVMEQVLAASPKSWNASQARSTAQGLFLLRSLIEPIFGRGTAQVAIDLAVRRCTAQPDMELRHDDWPVFVNNLSETLGSISGSAAARLVSRVGAALAEAA